MTQPARKPPQIAPRKRPLQARSTRTVDVLLEAAARVLEERGLAGYTTNAVAERSGVSVGSLYQYFPNKDALMSALVLRVHLQVAEQLAALQARLTGWPLAAAVEEMVRGAVHDARAAPRLLEAVEFEEERLPRSAELEAAEAAIHRNLKALVSPYLADDIDPARIDRAVQRIIGIVQGVVDTSVRHPADAEPLEQEVARAILGYLTPLLRGGEHARDGSPVH